MKRISLDLHDYSEYRLGFVWLNQLRQIYPDIKFSMFYIPVDQQYYGNYNDIEREEARKIIRTSVEQGVIELIPHGLTHRHGEYGQASYDDMQITLSAYEEHFKELGLPYVKGFCAPNWLMSKEAIQCLDDNGWWLAVDRNQPEALRAKKNYIYNWSIDEPMPKEDLIMGHGHMDSCANNLSVNIKNLIKIPQDYQWTFVSEIMKEQK